MLTHKSPFSQVIVMVDEKPKSMINKIKYTGRRNDPLDPEEENARMLEAERDQVKIDLFWVPHSRTHSFTRLYWLRTY